MLLFGYFVTLPVQYDDFVGPEFVYYFGNCQNSGF